MKPNLRNILSISLIVLAIGGGWYVVRTVGNDGEGGQGDGTQATESPAPTDPIEAAQEANSAGLSPEAAAVADATADTTFTGVYTNAQYGFSFRYPETLTVGEIESPTDEVTTIVAQDATSHIGFQIHITPFIDPDPIITTERIQQSLPDIDMGDAHQMVVGGNDGGISFLTKDASFGESRQVWVVDRSSLYQISTYGSQSVLLEKILTTWEFGI